MLDYNANICKLCQSSDFEVLNETADFKAITSDGKASERKWRKLVCKNCGLMREGNDYPMQVLEDHYENSYSINTIDVSEEHIFFRNNEKVPRNRAVAEEIAIMLQELDIATPTNIFEIGSGQGNLIRELTTLFPDASIAGVELSNNASATARERGWNVIKGDETKMSGNADLAVAITVLEHVPDPAVFLKNIYNSLNENGYLFLMQPVQNGNTYDIFYTDHLYHFNEKHVEWFANGAGFKQLALKFDPWFSKHMSIHLFQKNTTALPIEIMFIDQIHARESASYWINIFEKTNAFLEHNRDKKIAVYGMSEVLKIIYHFTALKKSVVVLGIDDYPERHRKNILNIPVKNLNDLNQEDIEKIDFALLTMNQIYYNHVIEKCKKINLECEGIY